MLYNKLKLKLKLNIRKRLTSFALAVLMLAAILPGSGLTVSAVNVWDGEHRFTLAQAGIGVWVLRDYYGPGGDVVVPAGLRPTGGYITEVFGNPEGFKIYPDAIGASITSLTISEGMMKIGANAFEACGMTTLSLPSTLTEIRSGAFNGSANLKSVVLPDSLVTMGERIFLNCTSLESATLPANLTYIPKWSFRNCESLTSVIIPGGVTEIREAAFENSGLTSVVLSSNLKSIGASAFAGTKLTSLHIPASVADIASDAFSGCDIKTVTVDANNPNYSAEGNVLFNKNKTELVYYFSPSYSDVLPGGGSSYDIPEGVTRIAQGAFAGSDIKSITLPSTLKEIGDSAFYDCRRLEQELILPNGLEKIGAYAFGRSPDVTTSVRLRGALVIPDSVASIGRNAFSGTLFESVNLPRNSSYTKVEDFTFHSIVNLKSIEIPGNIVEIGLNAFGSSTYLEEVIIPDSVKIIGNNAFSGFVINEFLGGEGGLKSVTIGNGVEVIGAYAFAYQPEIEEIILPPSVNFIGEYAFYDNRELKSINIPAGVTSIRQNTFDNCQKLTSIELPNTVNTIGANAFKDNWNLMQITIPRMKIVFGNSAFLRCPANMVMKGYTGSDVQNYAGLMGYTFEAMPGTIVDPDTKYWVIVDTDHKGSARAEPNQAMAGETVTLTVIGALPNHEFKEWRVITGNAALSSARANPATFTMPDEEVEILAVFAEIGEPELCEECGESPCECEDNPGDPDNTPKSGIDYKRADISAAGSVSGFEINLTEEKLIKPSGIAITSYSIDGGNKWKRGAPTDIDLAKLLNKDMTLHLKIGETETVEFPKINKRPAAPKFAVNYAIGADPTGKTPGDWLLTTKVKKGETPGLLKSGIEIGASDSAKKSVDDRGYGAFYAGGKNGVPVIALPSNNKAVKTTYFIRTAPEENKDGTYTAAGKAKKFTVSSELKQLKAVNPKTNKTTGEITIPLKKGIAYAINDGEVQTTGNNKAAVSVEKDDGVTLWNVATDKKPASKPFAFSID